MQNLIDELDRVIQKLDWPMEHRTTMQSRRIYESGLDTVNDYRGHPGIYVEALRRFQAAQSCPYAYAGIAYTLTIASSHGEDDKASARRGFKKAMTWLEKSQALEADWTEINFIEAIIYINQGQLENGRLILDYLIAQEPRNYYLCLTEMNYWQRRGDDQQYLRWLNLAGEGADNGHRHVFVLNSLANFYLEKRSYDKSIKLFQKVTEIDPEDPWAWHNMSVMYVRLKQFKEAKICNERALKVMDFGAAREIEQVIKKNIGGLGRLFGR